MDYMYFHLKCLTYNIEDSSKCIVFITVVTIMRNSQPKNFKLGDKLRRT